MSKKKNRKPNNRPAAVARPNEYGIVKPQDHRPKKSDSTIAEVELRGKTWTVDTDTLDDADLMEEIVGLQDGNPRAIFTVTKAILGEEQVKELKEVIRDETGKVPFSAYSEFFLDLMEELNPNS